MGNGFLRVNYSYNRKHEQKISLKPPKLLTPFMMYFMEHYMRPISKIVVKESSASDLTPGTAEVEAESEIRRNCQRGFDTQLQRVIKDKM